MNEILTSEELAAMLSNTQKFHDASFLSLEDRIKVLEEKFLELSENTTDALDSITEDVTQSINSFRAEGYDSVWDNISRWRNENKQVMDKQKLIEKYITDHALGVQNVYTKFLEIEKKQIEIENLLKSDKLKDIVRMIPTEVDIDKLLTKIKSSKIGLLDTRIKSIKDDLQELCCLFDI